MSKLRLVGILTPPTDEAWKPGVGTIRIEPANTEAENWTDGKIRPAWPIRGRVNALGNGFESMSGGALYVPGEQPGVTARGPLMTVTYQLQTISGEWYRGTFLWRAVSTGGGTIDIRTPAPETEPKHVERPGVPSPGLTTADIGASIAAANHTHTVAQITNLTTTINDAMATRNLTHHDIPTNETVSIGGQWGGLYRIWTAQALGFLELSIYSNAAGARRILGDTSMTLPSLMQAAIGLDASTTQVEPSGGNIRVWLSENGEVMIKNTYSRTLRVNIRRLE